VLSTYERRMDALATHPIFGYRISYRRILEVQARLLARTVLGELQEYPNYCTR
jgi:CRISPR-associated protein Cas1